MKLAKTCKQKKTRSKINSQKKQRTKQTTAKINSQKNCAQNELLQKCKADTFVYLLVERDGALSTAL